MFQCSTLVISCAQRPDMSVVFFKRDVEQQMKDEHVDPAKNNWIEWALNRYDNQDMFGMLRDMIAMPEFINDNVMLNNIVFSIVKIP